VVVLGDGHGGEIAPPDPRGAKRQLLEEEAIELPEPRSKVRPEIGLHEFGGVGAALEVFLRPIL
jgi:hypothetical protein